MGILQTQQFKFDILIFMRYNTYGQKGGTLGNVDRVADEIAKHLAKRGQQRGTMTSLVQNACQKCGITVEAEQLAAYTKRVARELARRNASMRVAREPVEIKPAPRPATANVLFSEGGPINAIKGR